ncbi:uncharacterized protein B0J16DRAFT_349815 [Fusarium flagelliforme]|uniref:non-specific serine/threonine protein kinase n=1 Tax=Fusarium flagelliforme TaxID=2675880 RepID=A0A395MSV4_9HYPO|nr:uncharacterized protein B0J16DRAFT_349815 [Fusarium flagelliforme]KAH7173270.1 hypothetical protein B0J16DRAFT_349815 [Fusarium flagelliforme]RFN50777.1 serine/threonine-protein kinase sgk2 [Fusarium flagelliforme]
MTDLDKIRNAIDGRIYGPLQGFYDVFFHSKAWYRGLEPLVTTGDPGFLHLSSSGGSTIDLDHLNTLLEGLTKDHCRQYHRPTTSRQVSETSFCLVERGGIPDWSGIMMIGDIDGDNNPRSYQQGLADLISLAEHVFEAQPIRRFLHGIYIRGCVAEPWVFDRMGLYSGQPFDLSKDGPRLAILLVGYSLMTNEELGMDTFIHKDNGQNFIRLSNSDSERLFLETRPFVTPRQLIGKAVACYKARSDDSEPWKAVVKFCWKSEKEEMEQKILHLVKERKVWGVIQLLDEGNIESIASMHRGLTLGVPRKLTMDKTISDTGLIDSQTIVGHSEPLQDKRSNLDESRMLSYTITSPYGRHIIEYTCIKEFLVALRDAIKAHRSLYTAGHILHRDISINNIIITEAMTPEESHGTLIDLDAALDMTAEKSSQKTITGTKPFMAIGLLHGEENAYQHDLESFFYVLLFSATIDRKVGLPPNTPLQRWVVGTWAELAVQKAHDLADPRFDEVLAGFQSDFRGQKGLARALRDIIIGKMISSEDEEGRLFDQIMETFDQAIAEQYKETAQI